MAFIQMVRMVAIALVALGLLGWLPWAAIGPVRRRVNGWFAAPFFGLAIIEVFGWYWLEWGRGGMRTGVLLLAALWLVGAVVVVLWPRPGGESLVPRFPRRGVLGGAIVVLGALTVAACVMLNGLKGSEPVPIWYGNADIASYAIVSQHYIDKGHDDVGWVSTGDLGTFGRDDAAGVRPFLASMAIVNGTDVATVMTPAIALTMVLLAVAAMWVVMTLVRAGPSVAAALALLVLVPFSLTYVAGQAYLAQVLSMAGMVAFVAVLLSGVYGSWRDALLVSIPAAFVMTPVVLSYPHMAAGSFVVVGVVTAVVRVESFHRSEWRATGLRVARAVVPVVVSAAAAAVVVAPVLGGLVDRAQQIATSDNGWPLVLMTPLEVLGLLPFRGMVESTRLVTFSNVDMTMPTALQWFGQAIVVVILLALGSIAAWRRRRALALFPIVAGVAVLASNRILFAQRGISYQQWKWITFFQPLLTLAAIVAVVFLVDALLSWYPARRQIIVTTTLVVTALAVVVSLRWDARMWSQDWPAVTADIAQLGDVPDSGLDHVNIAVEPYARTMWAAYYVAPLRTNILSGSYFPMSGDQSGWTITEPRYITGKPAQVIPINATFSFVCYKEPCGTAPVLPAR